jgi:hypothetical protein
MKELKKKDLVPLEICQKQTLSKVKRPENQRQKIELFITICARTLDPMSTDSSSVTSSWMSFTSVHILKLGLKEMLIKLNWIELNWIKTSISIAMFKNKKEYTIYISCMVFEIWSSYSMELSTVREATSCVAMRQIPNILWNPQVHYHMKVYWRN